MKYRLQLIFTFLIVGKSFSQNDTSILSIRKDFNSWQPILKKGVNHSKEFYKYVWGEKYQFSEWLDKKMENDTLLLVQSASIIEKQDLGLFIKMNFYSLSGDWYIVSDYYYNNDRQLYFVFWRMNTHQSEEPITVEKRLYFNKNMKLIQSLKSIYKMNTKKETNASFMDRQVQYRLILDEFPFLNK